MGAGHTRKELAALPCLPNGELDDDKIEWFPHVGGTRHETRHR
jgi:hypothetical protein